MILTFLQLQDAACIIRMLTTNVLLYLAVNLAGTYTKYLTDRGQRQAFLETHRSTETRQRTQNENNRQEKLLLSGKKVSFGLSYFSSFALKITVKIIHLIILTS